MARNRKKQGARKHRVRVYTYSDAAGSRVVKDANGRPVTRGVMHPAPNHWDLIERHRNEAKFWDEIRSEREAKRRIDEEEAARELVGA